MAKVRVGTKNVDSGPLLRSALVDGSNRSVVQSSRSGLLICVVHQTGWCEDVKKAIATQSDAASLFEDFKEGGTKKVVVPITPSQSIYGNVQLGLIKKDDYGTLACTLMKPDDSTPPPGAIIMHSIGLLCRGEGRMTLRRLILDWMGPYIVKGATPVKRCVAMSHSAGRQRLLLGAYDADDPRTRLGHHWTLTWYNKCMGCFQHEGAGSSFDPDLIPKL